MSLRSDAKTVDEYIESLTGERREAIVKLHEVLLSVVPNLEESMRYGMSTYSHGEESHAFASQKNYVSLYIHRSDLISK